MSQIKRKLLGEAQTVAGEVVFRCLVAGIPDRDGDVFPSLSALDMTAYMANPVLKFHHSRPGNIGHTKTWDDGMALYMSPVFSETDEFAMGIRAKVLDGTYRACSVGYIERAVKPNKYGGVDVLDAELIEISITDVPANPLAVRIKTADSSETETTATVEAKSNPEPWAAIHAEIASMRALIAERLPSPPLPSASSPAEKKTTEVPAVESAPPPPSTSTQEMDSAATFFDGWVQ